MEREKYLYEQFLKGDKNSFEKIINENKINLIYFILKYVKNIDIAEDIFQDVIVYILEHKEYYKFEYSFKTYMYTIAKSKSIDFIRRKKDTICLDENLEMKQEQLLEEIILNKDIENRIQKVINKLSEEYQMVIYLTQIEKLSYKEAGLILNKDEKQIKNMVYYARKKLKQLLLEEKIVEIKDNKLIKLFVIFAVLSVVISSATYTGIAIYKYLKTTLSPAYSAEIIQNDDNIIWIGSFQLAWNELIDYFGHDIEFENYQSDLINNLNKKIFSKEMLSEEDYYIKVAKSNENLKEEIYNDLNKKFNMNSRILDEVNFGNSNGIIVYSQINKKFEFLNKFDVLTSSKFGDSEEEVYYFGINNKSDKNLYKNVEILCFEPQMWDYYGVKLKTKENEDVILYKTETEGTFEEIYNELLTNTEFYNEDRKFKSIDSLRVPYINMNYIINYDELCGKIIKETNGVHIEAALQTVEFYLTPTGGKLISEAAIKTQSMSAPSTQARVLDFSKPFYIFLKEEGKENPYLAVKIENIDFLEIVK